MAEMKTKLKPGEICYFKAQSAFYKFVEIDEYKKYLFELLYPRAYNNELVLKHGMDLYSNDLVRVLEASESEKRMMIKVLMKYSKSRK